MRRWVSRTLSGTRREQPRRGTGILPVSSTRVSRLRGHRQDAGATVSLPHRRLRRLIAPLVCLSLAPMLSSAQMNTTLLHQGRLMQPGGNPFPDGTHAVTFTIYDAPSGGTLLFEELHSLQTTNGFYATSLGYSGLEENLRKLFEKYDDLFLHLIVGGHPVRPVTRLASSAYAIRAGWLPEDAVTSRSIAPGAVASEHLDVSDLVTSLNGLTDDIALEAGPGIELHQGEKITWVSLTGVSEPEAEALTATFPVATGESVQAGDVVYLDQGTVRRGWWGTNEVFMAGAQNLSVSAMGAAHFVITYSLGDTNWVQVASVVGRTISYGTPMAYATGLGHWDERDVAGLSDSRFVVAYSSSDDLGKVRVGEVSGNTITSLGTPETFSFGSDVDLLAVCRVHDTQFAVAWELDGDGIYGIAGNVSGTSVGWAGSYGWISANPETLDLAAVSSSRVRIAYGGPTGGYSALGRIIGGNFSFSTARQFVLDEPLYVTVSALDEFAYVVGYIDTDWRGHVVLSTGTDFGAPYEVNDSLTYEISVVGLGEDAFVVTYIQSSYETPSIMTARRGSAHGLEARLGAERPVTPYGLSEPWDAADACALGEHGVVALYRTRDVSASLARAAVAVCGRPIGIAEVAASAGASCPATLSGVADVFSGLQPGTTYYDDNGILGPTRITGRKVGLAVAPDALYLKPEWGW